MQAEMGNTIQQFANDPANEFYSDVQGDMADIMDMAAARGQKLGLKEAYDKACLMHPTISQITQNRQAQAAVQQKRQAASSIHGGPGGAQVTQPGSITAALNDAWDNAGRP